MLIKRIIALIIDSILIAIISGFLAQENSALGAISYALLTIAYQAIFLTVMNGQTPGKMLMGIRVVSASGGQISPIQAALRGLGYVINSYTCGIGWLLAALNIFSIHDTLAGSRVVE